MEQREVVCTVCILLVNTVYSPCGALDPCAKVTTEKQRRKRPDTVRSVVGWIIEALIWRREREGRDGLNSAPKTGCNTSNMHRHAANTHIQRHTHKRLVRGHVNGVAQPGRQTGPHRSLLCPEFHSVTHQTQKNERPETQLTCCYSY